jgi:tetratricopeptide (TPR) repeat protein
MRDSLYAEGNNFTFYNWKCWVAFTRGDLNEANRLLEEDLKSRSKTMAAEGIIGDAMFLAGIYDLFDYAIFWMDKAREYYPSDAHLHYHLARLHLEQKNDYKTGVPFLEKAVQLDSAHAYAHYHLAAAYAHLGKNKAALNYLEQALQKGYEDFESMEKDARWERLREDKRYKELMKRYTPEK